MDIVFDEEYDDPYDKDWCMDDDELVYCGRCGVEMDIVFDEEYDDPYDVEVVSEPGCDCYEADARRVHDDVNADLGIESVDGFETGGGA
jgi:hypothetical protein